MSQRRPPNVSSQKKPPRTLQEPATDASGRPVAEGESAATATPPAAFDEQPTMTFSRPLAKLSPRSVVVQRAARAGNRTHVFTSGVLGQPRPPATHEPTAPVAATSGVLGQPRPTATHEPTAPVSADSATTAGDHGPQPATAPSGWTLERKLVAANLVLVLVAIVEFFVL
ncbi:hypothetical protein OV142_34130 [Nannocystis sp. SCPEA4]|nr:hypothetical protein [Nannocystis sp. SCPEA4]